MPSPYATPKSRKLAGDTTRTSTPAARRCSTPSRTNAPAMSPSWRGYDVVSTTTRMARATIRPHEPPPSRLDAPGGGHRHTAHRRPDRHPRARAVLRGRRRRDPARVRAAATGRLPGRMGRPRLVGRLVVGHGAAVLLGARLRRVQRRGGEPHRALRPQLGRHRRSARVRRLRNRSRVSRARRPPRRSSSPSTALRSSSFPGRSTSSPSRATRRSGSSSPRRSACLWFAEPRERLQAWQWYAVSALVIGLGSLTKAQFVVFLPAFCLLVLDHRREGRCELETRRRRHGDGHRSGSRPARRRCAGRLHRGLRPLERDRAARLEVPLARGGVRPRVDRATRSCDGRTCSATSSRRPSSSPSSSSSPSGRAAFSGRCSASSPPAPSRSQSRGFDSTALVTTALVASLVWACTWIVVRTDELYSSLTSIGEFARSAPAKTLAANGTPVYISCEEGSAAIAGYVRREQGLPLSVRPQEATPWASARGLEPPPGFRYALVDDAPMSRGCRRGEVARRVDAEPRRRVRALRVHGRRRRVTRARTPRTRRRSRRTS